MRLSPILILAAAATGLAACADYPPPPPYYGPPPGPGAHVRWCLSHHPGYDPRTNIFADANGNLHPCHAPWERRQPPPPAYGPPPPPPAYGPPPPPP
jgi:hypothetical protein